MPGARGHPRDAPDLRKRIAWRGHHTGNQKFSRATDAPVGSTQCHGAQSRHLIQVRAGEGLQGRHLEEVTCSLGKQIEPVL